MSKVDFINDFKDICGDIEFVTEQACKVTSEYITTDKVNVTFKKVSRRTLIDLASKTFDNVGKVTEFINKIYDQYEDKIHTTLFGYIDDTKEIYFEVKEPYESSDIFSYDEGNDIFSEYKATDISDIIKEFSDDVSNKTGIILPATIFKSNFGFIKNGVYVGMPLFEPLSGLSSVLLEYSKHINSNTEELEKWMEQHSSNLLTFLGYKNENGKISLNIYTKQQ